jgi:hypothetical protein
MYVCLKFVTKHLCPSKYFPSKAIISLGAKTSPNLHHIFHLKVQTKSTTPPLPSLEYSSSMQPTNSILLTPKN